MKRSAESLLSIEARVPHASYLIRRWRRRIVHSAFGALGACAGYQPMSTTVDVAAAEQLETAEYYAFLHSVGDEASFGGARGPAIELERPPYRCAQYLVGADVEVHELEGDPSCPASLAQWLRGFERYGRALVVRRGGRDIVYDSVAELGPIDSAAEALAAVWLDGRYSLSFAHGPGYIGSLSDGQVRPADGGFEVIAGSDEEGGDCDETVVENYRVTLLVRRDGSIEVRDRSKVSEYEVADPCQPLGRRPEGFVDLDHGTSLREYLARAAHHEAESVRAFRRLARELVAFGAPDELVTAARTAAEDEVRHTQMWVSLAMRLGAVIEANIASDELPVRSLETCAVDNAVEGCVFEAYGAVLALYQASRAERDDLKAHFSVIARDELDHAALSHATAELLNSRLDPSARRRQRDAVTRARDELVLSIREPGVAERLLGYPSAAGQRVLFDRGLVRVLEA